MNILLSAVLGLAWLKQKTFVFAGSLEMLKEISKHSNLCYISGVVIYRQQFGFPKQSVHKAGSRPTDHTAHTRKAGLATRVYWNGLI